MFIAKLVINDEVHLQDCLIHHGLVMTGSGGKGTIYLQGLYTSEDIAIECFQSIRSVIPIGLLKISEISA